MTESFKRSPLPTLADAIIIPRQSLQEKGPFAHGSRWQLATPACLWIIEQELGVEGGSELGNQMSTGDGFRFGCGFFAAGCLVYACATVLAAVGAILLSLLGMGSFLPQLSTFPGSFRCL